MSLVTELSLLELYESPSLRPLLINPAMSISYQLQTEAAVDEFWKGGYHNLDEFYAYNPDYRSQLLTEGAGETIKRHAINLVQAAIGFGAEGGITVAGAGASAPAGVAAETAIDIGFAAAQTTAAMAAMSSIGEGADDAQEIWDALGDIDMSSGLDGIYEAVETIVENAVALAKKVGMKLEEFLIGVHEKLSKVLSRVASAAGDLISILIPADAGTGGAVIGEVIIAAGENGYTMLSKAYNVMPDMATEMLEDPASIVTFMDSIIDLVKNFVEEFDEESDAAENEEDGFWDKVADAGVEYLKIMGRIGAFMLTAGISEVAMLGIKKYKSEIVEWLDGPVRSGLKDVANAINTIIPWVFAVLAFIQVIIKEGFVSDGDDDEDEDEDSDKAKDKKKDSGEKKSEEKKEKLAAGYIAGSLKTALLETG